MTKWEVCLQVGVLKIESLAFTDEELEIQVHVAKTSANCPQCGQCSRSVHSHYYRHLKDLPVSERQVHLVVQIRRFRCLNEHCSYQTFAESLEAVAPAFSRRTHRLTKILRQVGLMLEPRRKTK